MRALALLITFPIAFSQTHTPDACLGEFEVCPSGGCVLDASFCGICKTPGDYLCQDSTTCVSNAVAVLTCPLIAPLFNWTLPIYDRVSRTVAMLTLEEKAALIVMQSPVSCCVPQI